jgi:DNA primase
LNLNAARGAEARAYLDRRGLAPAARDRFEIGYAPDAGAVLAEHLAAKGFSREEAADAGLTAIPEDGRAPYDRFRGRIVFPIRDARGRAIALGGRALDPNARAKYLNSPETPLFDKSRTLFNLGPARAAAGKSGRLIVVEGYMDAIALAEAGLPETVAPLGTAITEAQLEALWRVVPEPLVALDGDAAGLKAAHRLIDLALPQLGAGRSLRFVLMPPGQDPDDVVRAGGRAAMEALLEASVPVVELLWRRESEGQVLDSPERRTALGARLKAHLARFRDDDLRAHTRAAFRERLARLFAATPPRPARGGTPRPGVRGDRFGFAPGRGPGRFAPPPVASAAAKASLLGRARDGVPAEARLRESAILYGLINHPALAASLEDRLDRMTFVCTDLAELRDALIACLAETSPPPALPAAGPAAGAALGRRHPAGRRQPAAGDTSAACRPSRHPPRARSTRAARGAWTSRDQSPSCTGRGSRERRARRRGRARPSRGLDGHGRRGA